MKKIFFLIASGLLLVSCTKIVSTIYGMKDPNIPVSDLEIIKFTKEINVDTVDIFRPKVEANYKEVSVFFDGHITDGLIFDKQGQEIIYKTPEQNCSDEIHFISTLDKNDKVKIGQKELKDLLKKVTLIQGSKEVQGNYDYVLVISWASFMGKRFNTENVSQWEKFAKTNPKSKIRILKINMDIKKEWQK